MSRLFHKRVLGNESPVPRLLVLVPHLGAHEAYEEERRDVVALGYKLVIILRIILLRPFHREPVVRAAAITHAALEPVRLIVTLHFNNEGQPFRVPTDKVIAELAVGDYLTLKFSSQVTLWCSGRSIFRTPITTSLLFSSPKTALKPLLVIRLT